MIRTEWHTYSTGQTRVRIHHDGFGWPLILTLPEARDLYTQLTPILEQVANEEREDVTD